VKWQHAREEKNGDWHNSKRVHPSFCQKSESGNHLVEVVQLRELWLQLIVCNIVFNMSFALTDRYGKGEFGPNRRQVKKSVQACRPKPKWTTIPA